MKNVKIVDYFAVGTFHEVVNYSFIKMSAGIFKRVKYLSGKSAGKNLMRMFERLEMKIPDKISFGVLPNVENDTPMGARLRDLWGFFLTLYQYLITPYNTLLFYNYTNKLSLPWILFLNIVLRKKIVFVFHGELEFLEDKVSYLKTSGWYKLCMCFSFRYLFMKSPAYVLVLGDSIRKNLSGYYPHLFPHILSICHPYILNKEEQIETEKKAGIIRMGTVGTMKESKGLKNLLLLSDLIGDLLSQNKLELYNIGRVYANGMDLGNSIIWAGHEKGLPRDDFEKLVGQLDYLLYLYPLGSYRFTASGAILDAVKMKKPIISLHNDYFNYLLHDCPIGYMANSVEEVEQFIRNIVAGKLHGNFSAGFNSLSDKISIEKNMLLFKYELSRIQVLSN